MKAEPGSSVFHYACGFSPPSASTAWNGTPSPQCWSIPFHSKPCYHRIIPFDDVWVGWVKSLVEARDRQPNPATERLSGHGRWVSVTNVLLFSRLYGGKPGRFEQILEAVGVCALCCWRARVIRCGRVPRWHSKRGWV